MAFSIFFLLGAACVMPCFPKVALAYDVPKVIFLFIFFFDFTSLSHSLIFDTVLSATSDNYDYFGSIAV